LLLFLFFASLLFSFFGFMWALDALFWGAFFFLCFDAKKNPGDPFRKKGGSVYREKKGSEKESLKGNLYGDL
jgi:hypothetical protein